MKHNPKRTKKLRRHLRNNMTQSEVMLWDKLKGKQLLGYKIRRQHGIGNYVIDFYCPELRIGIEVDGDSHFTPKGKISDRIKDKLIAKEGIHLIRIINTEIEENLDGVMEYLATEFQKKGLQH